MRGIWLEEGKLRLRGELPIPVPLQGEGLVRVLRAPFRECRDTSLGGW